MIGRCWWYMVSCGGAEPGRAVLDEDTVRLRVRDVRPTGVEGPLSSSWTWRLPALTDTRGGDGMLTRPLVPSSSTGTICRDIIGDSIGSGTAAPPEFGRRRCGVAIPSADTTPH